MSTPTTISLGELMARRAGSVDPSRFPEESFDVFSVPAFDTGKPEVIVGRAIGSSKQIVQTGDVLLSKIVPHIRRCWVVGKSRGRRMIASSEWIIFRSIEFHPDYLRHVLVGDNFHARFMQTVSGVGGSLLRARPAYLAEIEIALPALSEQRRIAEQLERADRLGRIRRYVTELSDNFAPAAFLELFGDHVLNQKQFQVAELGEYLSFVTSGSRGWAEYYAPEGDRFIRSLDVRMNYVSDEDAVFVKAPAGAEAERARVRTDDVLLTITGSQIGRVAPVPSRLEGAFVSQHVAILRLKPGLLPTFVSMFMSIQSCGQREIARFQYGQTKPGLSLGQIGEFKILVPPLSLQRQLDALIAEQERLRTCQREAQRQAEHLILTLSHRAFRESVQC